jgi:hypothetical protein
VAYPLDGVLLRPAGYRVDGSRFREGLTISDNGFDIEKFVRDEQAKKDRKMADHAQWLRESRAIAEAKAAEERRLEAERRAWPLHRRLRSGGARRQLTGAPITISSAGRVPTCRGACKED